MKNMNRCKRVSFSSNGSMVETLIIEDFPESHYYNEAHDYTHDHSTKTRHSTGDVHVNGEPPADDKKHVTIKITDASDEETQSSVGDTAEISRPESPSSQSGQWPLKRSQSVDSRDNPFLPGGNLRKEAEDILSRATIIRDTFILPEDGSGAGGAANTSPEKNTNSAKTDSPNAQTEEPVMETMTTEVVKNTESSAVPNSETSTDTRHKENGQLDTENSLTPGSVKVEIVEECKERKKQQKCCAVM